MIKRKADVVQTSTNTNIHNTNVTGIVNKRFDEPPRYGQGHYVETMKDVGKAVHCRIAKTSLDAINIEVCKLVIDIVGART